MLVKLGQSVGVGELQAATADHSPPTMGEDRSRDRYLCPEYA